MSLRINRILLLVLAASVLLGPLPTSNAQRRGGMRPWLERLGRLRVPGPNERNHQSVREAYRDLVKPLGPSVVRVIASGAHVAYGTVVDSTGLVMTKSSELKSDPEILCQLNDGRRVPAKVVASDTDTDLALLQLEIQETMTPVSWRDSPVEVGSWLACVGLGQLPIATGVVSNTPRRIPRRLAYLGVMLNNDQTPQVMEVVNDSAASRAGIAAQDVVLEVAGKPVAGRESVIRAIRELRPGDSLTLKIRRSKKAAESEDNKEAKSSDGQKQDSAEKANEPKPEKQPAPAEEPKKSGDEAATPAAEGDFEELELQAVLGDMDEQNPQANLGGPLSGRRGGFTQALQHDAILVPQDCGGPIVDLDGKTVGINIARAGRVETYALPAPVVQAVLKRLRAEANLAAAKPEAEAEGEKKVSIEK